MKKCIWALLPALMLFSSLGNAADPYPATGPQAVCMVGDSITRLGQYWRSRMAMTRGADWHYVDNFFDEVYYHDGVGGDKTTDILDRIWTIQGCDIVLLMAGGNDLAQKRTPGSVVTNLQAIADTFAAQGATVYVQTLLPARVSTEENLVIAYTNKLIKDTFK
jgi:hypothetical protein